VHGDHVHEGLVERDADLLDLVEERERVVVDRCARAAGEELV
jgi:hypothetical protein